LANNHTPSLQEIADAAVLGECDCKAFWYVLAFGIDAVFTWQRVPRCRSGVGCMTDANASFWGRGC
jgi:hypothetical protein